MGPRRKVGHYLQDFRVVVILKHLVETSGLELGDKR